VRWPVDDVDADEQQSALGASAGPKCRADFRALAAGVRSVAWAAPRRATMLERRSSGAGTRVDRGRRNSPSTRMMRLSPCFDLGKKEKALDHPRLAECHREHVETANRKFMSCGMDAKHRRARPWPCSGFHHHGANARRGNELISSRSLEIRVGGPSNGGKSITKIFSGAFGARLAGLLNYQRLGNEIPLQKNAVEVDCRRDRKWRGSCRSKNHRRMPQAARRLALTEGLKWKSPGSSAHGEQIEPGRPIRRPRSESLSGV